MTIYLSLLVAVVAGIIFAITAKEKLQRLCLVAFGCGLLAFLIQIGSTSIKALH